MYILSSVYNVNVRFSFVINYVSEHRLPHAIDAFYTTPTTHVNQGHILLKMIDWRHYLYFKWISCIPEITTQTPSAEPALPQGSQVRCIIGQVTCITCIIRTRTGRGVSHPRDPTVDPSFGCATYILSTPKYRCCLLQ